MDKSRDRTHTIYLSSNKQTWGGGGGIWMVSYTEHSRGMGFKRGLDQAGMAFCAMTQKSDNFSRCH